VRGRIRRLKESLTMRRRGIVLALLVALLALPLAACGAGSNLRGAPAKDGEYPVRQGSITYDGQHYKLFWQDGDQFKELQAEGLKMVKDEQRTFLSKKGNEVVLHLTENEPIETLGQDGNGTYSSPWFPFFAGALIGNALGGPSYRYPPTDTFGRGDRLQGSVVTETAKPPAYAGLPPNPNAVSGQNQGTGGGVAATNKVGGPDAANVPNAGAAAGVSGAAAGAGAGVAATAKGGFRSGPNSFENRTVNRPAGGGTNVNNGSGQRAQPNAPQSAPKPRAPSGGRSGGGRSGGK
jgi:hypothetical protein